MKDIIFRIAEIIAYIGVALVCRYVIPYVKTKLEESKYAFLTDMIIDAVYATEQIYQGEKMGVVRKDEVSKFAMNIIKEKGWNITPEQVENIIEAAVKGMNAGE